MQLVAYGAQDIYLTGNPQITFFKVVYRRHTNFSMEAIEQTFNGTVSYDSSVDCTIARNGDLIHKMYIEFNPKTALCNSSSNSPADVFANVGHTLLKAVELEIGGQRIDKHYSHWLTTWNELTDVNPSGSKMSLSIGGSGTAPLELAHGTADGGTDNVLTPVNINDDPTQYQLQTFNHLGNDSVNLKDRTRGSSAFVPLQFWFCRNIGLSLPLIALQYHEVKVKMDFCALADVTTHTGGDISHLKFWVDYIYLDTDERRRFAQVSHEYLIEQLQTQTIGVATSGASYTFNFNHPVKELIFIGEPTTGAIAAGPGTPRAVTDDRGTTFKLKLNGHDRFAERKLEYFTCTQVLQNHSGFGGTSVKDSIGVYSFALKPEEHQPSGTCNFSRIDNSQFVVGGTTSGNDVPLRLYAVNYNVLRIMSGMGGLAYSN